MRKRTIGLEFTDQAIYLIEIVSKNGQAYVKRAQEVRLPPGVIDGGEPKNVPLLREVLAPFSIRKFSLLQVPVVAGISGQQAFIRKISIPAVPDNEIADIMRWEVENVLPYPIHEVCYSYQILEKREREYQILFAALSQERMQNYLGLFRGIGLSVKILTFLPFGLVNYVEYVGEKRYSGVLARLRKTMIEFVLLANGEVEVVRMISIPYTLSESEVADFFITELNSTLGHFHSIKDTWLNAGIFFGSGDFLHTLRDKMPLFYWRHFQLLQQAIFDNGEFSTGILQELPGIFGLALLGVIK